MTTIRVRFRAALGLVLGAALTSCRAPSESVTLNPTIAAVVAGISEQRIEASLRTIEAFGTRHILSGPLGPQRGIDAARDWLVRELSSYDARLQVSVQAFRLPKGTADGAVLRDVELGNVVAVLPGTSDPEHQILITAHYDTVNLHRRPVLPDEERARDLVERRQVDEAEARRMTELFPRDAVLGRLDEEATAAAEQAPGVADDGSGVAALLEIARVMSQQRFEKTLVFVAFAAEEVGLEGSKFYATRAREDDAAIEAVLNNDIIGTDVAGNGRAGPDTVRVFGDGPEDSPSRALLRYTKLIGERYVPSMRVQMVFRRDRFQRGGDHTSFLTRGFAAVRLTSAAENYAHQHNATDTLDNASAAYTTQVARINAAVAASLASAPSPPVVNYTIASGLDKGNRMPLLSRGESGYAASLRWTAPAASDVAGYTIMIRDTTSADWQRAIPVGPVTRHTIEDFSIDDVVLGVKAIDRDGNESVVAAYLEPISQRLTAAPAAPVAPAPSSESSNSN
jgi:peptidase M28-like protein